MTFLDQPFPQKSAGEQPQIPIFSSHFDLQLLPIEEGNEDSNPINGFLLISSSFCTDWFVNLMKLSSRVLVSANVEFMADWMSFHGAFDRLVP